MRKIFLSVPMKDLTKEEIQANIDWFKPYLTDEDEPVNNIIEVPEGSPRLYGLGEAIKKLGDCDEVWMHPNWRFHNGCHIEHETALLYGITVHDFFYERTRQRLLEWKERYGS